MQLMINVPGPIFPRDPAWCAKLLKATEDEINFATQNLHKVPSPLFGTVLEIRIYCVFMPPEVRARCHTWSPSVANVIDSIGETLCGILWHSECEIINAHICKTLATDTGRETNIPGLTMFVEGL